MDVKMKRVVFKSLVVSLLLAMVSSTMLAADWSAFGLKGKVKSVTYYNCSFPYMWPYNEEIEKVSFNRAGVVVTPKYVKAIRNKKGVIVNFKYYMSDWGEWFDQKITYDSDGRVIRVASTGVDGGGCTEFHYDDKGLVYQLIINGSADGEDYTQIITITYKSFDAKGNWTKRVCKSTTSYNSGDYPSITDAVTETRKLFYYK